MPAMITFSTTKVTVIQSAVLLLLTLVAFLLLGKVSAYSVFLGGLISVIPNAYFASKVFSHAGARSVEKVVQSFYLGELIKLVLMGTGFALVFALVEPLSALAVFAGFVLTHIAGLAGVVWLTKRQNTG